MCVLVVQLLCESVQHSDVLQTMQLVFSGAEVSCLNASAVYVGQKTVYINVRSASM